MQVFKPTRPPAGAPVAERPAQLSVLAEGLRVVGELESAGTITVAGRLEGNLRGRTQVLIAAGGIVVGDVTAAEVVVVGRVEGNVTATGRVELRDGGVIRGDLTTPSVAVQEGGVVNGRVRAERPAAKAGLPATPLRKTA